MFFYNSALLMDAPWIRIVQALLTASFGVYLLAAGVQGWYFAKNAGWLVRAGLVVAALLLIAGGWVTDVMGVALALALMGVQKAIASKATPRSA